MRRLPGIVLVLYGCGRFGANIGWRVTLVEPAHFIAQRRMLLGIKHRAERGIAASAT